MQIPLVHVVLEMYTEITSQGKGHLQPTLPRPALTTTVGTKAHGGLCTLSGRNQRCAPFKVHSSVLAS